MSYFIPNTAQKPAIAKCQNCGRDAQMNRPWSLFCSVSCRTAFYVRSDSPSPRTDRCESCGQPFTTRRSAKRFCSDQCRLDFHENSNPRLGSLKTTSEMAAMLGVSVSTIRTRIRSGHLVAHRVGGILLVNVRAGGTTREKQSVGRPVAEAFTAFAAKYGLSCKALGDACGVSKASAFRLLRGETTADAYERSRPSITRKITAFLSSLGLSPEDTASEIQTLFKEH